MIVRVRPQRGQQATDAIAKKVMGNSQIETRNSDGSERAPMLTFGIMIGFFAL